MASSSNKRANKYSSKLPELAGKLHLLPRYQIPSGVQPIRLRQIEPREVDVYFIDADKQNTRANGQLYLWAISKFYKPSDGKFIVTTNDLAGSLFSIMINLIGLETFISIVDVKKACREANIKLSMRSVTGIEVKSLLRNINCADAFHQNIQTFEKYFLDHYEIQYAMLGVLLLNIGIKVREKEYESWYKKKIAEILEIFDASSLQFVLPNSSMPAVSPLNWLHNWVESSDEFRRGFLRAMIELSAGKYHYCKLFQKVLSEIEGVGIAHMLLIEKYLYNSYPQLLGLSVLRSDYEGLKIAWEYFSSLKEEERKFAKVLFRIDKTYVLDSHRFPSYVAAATTVAEFETSSTVHRDYFQSFKMIFIEETVRSWLLDFRGKPAMIESGTITDSEINNMLEELQLSTKY